MEIEELDRTLLSLTESEKRYKGGEHFDWDQYETTYVDFDGRKVMRLKGAPLFHGGHANDLDQDQSMRPKPFVIRRNSRFNPVPEHVHTLVEMSYVYKGSCPQTVDGEKVLLKEGQVLLLDVDCPHSVGELGEQDIMLSIMFTRDFLGQALVDATAPESVVSRFLVTALADQTNHQHHVRFHSQGSRRVRRYFEELLCEYLDPSPNSEQIMQRLFQLVMIELVNIYEQDYTMREQAEKRVSVVPIIRYIEENCATCTQEEVAARFYISSNYVSTLLKRHTGMTYSQTVQAQRLTRAARLLRSTDETVESVAHACGYENLSFFYKKFRTRYGCLPAEFRERKG